MEDNISKLLYLSFGVLLLVLGLSAFYSNNQSFFKFNHVYESSKTAKDSWLVEVTRENRNPLGLSVSDSSVTKSGLVFKGSEVKNQLLIMMNYDNDYVVYKDGTKILASDYGTLYDSMEADDQMLITYDYQSKSVYIVTL